MTTTYCVRGTRPLVVSVMACLAVLCTPTASIAASDSAAKAADRAGALLATGAGYGQPQGDPRVLALQRRLRAIGQHPGPVDGLYGPLTEGAVERLQRDSGLSIDGVAGPQTRRVLNADAPPLVPGAGYGRAGGSRQVRQVQRRLRALGHHPGPVDGLYGPRTRAAVERFQRSAGQPAGGVLAPASAVILARADADRVSARQGGNDQSPRRPTSETEPSGVDDRRRQAEQAKPGQGPDESKAPQAASAEETDGAESTTWVLLAVLALALAAIGALLARVLKGGNRRTIASATAERSAGRELGQSGYGTTDEPDAGATATPTPGPAPQRSGAVALGYASVLGPEPLDGPQLLDQMASIERACDQLGLELKDVVREVERADTTGPERSGIRYALQELTDGEASCLVVAELGRLSHSVPEIGQIVEALRQRQVRLVAVQDEMDTATAVGARAAEILVSLGTFDAQRGKPAEEGDAKPAPAKPPPERANGSGRLPRGDVLALKDRIQSMRANGMTLQAIADQLNSEKVPTLRGGTQWRPSGVQAAAGYRRPTPVASQSGDGGESDGNGSSAEGNGDGTSDESAHPPVAAPGGGAAQ